MSVYSPGAGGCSWLLIRILFSVCPVPEGFHDIQEEMSALNSILRREGNEFPA
jgi:hypothetical protein